MNSKFLLAAVAASLFALSACESEASKTEREYAEWREVNDEWLREQQLSGLYTRYTPVWNEGISVEMRWLNDRTQTEGNLTPLYTSEVKVKYKGWLYDSTPFDSSYLQTDSCATVVPSDLIQGWAIALEQMRVGDKVEVLIPYAAAYGSSGMGSVPPYSNLRFELELKDITAYELKP